MNSSHDVASKRGRERNLKDEKTRSDPSFSLSDIVFFMPSPQIYAEIFNRSFMRFPFGRSLFGRSVLFGGGVVRLRRKTDLVGFFVKNDRADDVQTEYK